MDNEIEFDDYKGLELGCGDKKAEGFLGVDKFETEAADLIHDLDEFPWPLPDNHFEEVRAIDVFEHVENPIQFMEEIYRVCEDGAEVTIRSPHQSSQNWTDLTHKRLVGWRTFSLYFDEGKWSNNRTSAQFREIEREFTFRDYPLNWIGKWLAKRQPLFYEQSPLSRIFPACNLKFRLKVIK